MILRADFPLNPHKLDLEALEGLTNYLKLSATLEEVKHNKEITRVSWMRWCM